MLHWKNSAFQTLAFVALRCHTAEEAYRKVTLAAKERERAIQKNTASKLRNRALLMKAEERIASAETDSDRMLAEADAIELRDSTEHNQELEAEAKDELAFLQRLLDVIAPFCTRSLQGAQRIEWCMEFIRRAENYIASAGRIPPEQLDAMRSHPDFKSTIMPAIENIKNNQHVLRSEPFKRLVKRMLEAPVTCKDGE